MRLPSGRPRSGRLRTTHGRGCAGLPPRGTAEARIRIALLRWSPFGQSHGRCYCDALRCSALSMRVVAMKRRSRAGDKPAKARRRKALKRKGGSAPKAVSLGLGQTEVARLTRERDEALAQQVATADVLQTISSSPGNLDTVLGTILANATRLCEANFGVLLLYEGAQFHVAAAHNPPPAYAELRRRQPQIRCSGVLARSAVTKQLLHIADCTEDPSYKQGDDDFVAFVDLCGVRTLLDAPCLRKVNSSA
jgi:hypothetical protein